MILKIRRTLGSEIIHNLQFQMNTIILRNNKTNVEIFCSDFTLRKGKVAVLVYIPSEKVFVKTEMHNEYTKVMYEYAQKFKDKSKSLNYKQMMTHERKRKNGSGGVHIRKFCGQVTDYECAKEPLHDFRRVYN